MAQADWQAGGFGVYIHWPFCEAKCPYCDFNSHVSNAIDHTAWRKRLEADIRFQAYRLGSRSVKSIFFGGGTPSLMEPKTVAACIDTVADVFHLEPNAEITLEANPTSVEAKKFREFASAGVNRVSIGVQALNDTDLKRLGRLHSVSEATQAIDLARNHFDRMSFDLIYARQNQTATQWADELSLAISLSADHLSLYQLTIEAGTAFGRLHQEGKLRGLPSDALSADLYELTQETCSNAGLRGYEVSNHARPGYESRHNLIYWRYGDYLGVGPGAHGRLTVGGQRIATEATLMPSDWLNAASESATKDIETLSDEDQLTEFMLMGLRLSEGVDLKRAENFGASLPQNKITELIDSGHLIMRDKQISVPQIKKIVLNHILRDLLS
ncbi:MAG: radical SAM family heme chaperone HemW [Pseudomonadota bacterium]